jgi:hypothetical protein
MEQKTMPTTVEMDHVGFSDLQSQILEKRQTPNPSNDIREEKKEEISAKKEIAPSNKKFVFKRGEEAVELDDDFELEMMADKRPLKMTLKELKDRAAGDVAVKNRMHALAEEKKRVQATFKEFAEMSRKDPLAALEFISNKAKEADGEFEYNKYIEKLAEQAEKLGQMDEKERKALELQKKLEKAETDLSRNEREKLVVLRKQEILSNYPEIGDSQFRQMVDWVLSEEKFMESIEDENGVMDKVEELIQETLTQRDILQVIREINPSHINDNALIFSLSEQLKQNPDLDEEDVRDIIGELIAPAPKRDNNSSERERASRVLSQKVRQATPVKHIKSQNLTPYELLQQQLMERRDELKNTPLYMR